VEDQVNNIVYKSGFSPDESLDVLDATVDTSLKGEVSEDDALQNPRQMQPPKKRPLILYIIIGLLLVGLCLLVLKKKHGINKL